MTNPARESGTCPSVAGSWSLLSASLLVRATGALAGLALQVVVARALGVDGAGSFSIAVTLLTLFTLGARFGLDVGLMRSAAGDAHERRSTGLARRYGEVLGATSSLGLLAGAALLLASGPVARAVFADPDLAPLLQIIAVSILPVALIGVQGGLLKALGRPVTAAVVEVCLLPATSVGVALALHASVGLGLRGMALAYLAGAIAACAVGTFTLAREFDGRAVLDGIRRPRLALGGFDLVGVELLNFALPAAAILLVGALAGPADTGIYNAAVRLANQANLIAVMVGASLAPGFAALYARGEIAQLSALYRRATAVTVALTSPLLAAMLFHPALALVLFGEPFEAMTTPLRFLAAAQLVNVLSGPCGYVLMMTGHERDLRNLLVVTVSVTAPMMAVLTLVAGASGAALAALVGSLIQNVAALYAVQHRVGVAPLASGARRGVPAIPKGVARADG